MILQILPFFESGEVSSRICSFLVPFSTSTSWMIDFCLKFSDAPVINGGKFGERNREFHKPASFLKRDGKLLPSPWR